MSTYQKQLPFVYENRTCTRGYSWQTTPGEQRTMSAMARRPSYTPAGTASTPTFAGRSLEDYAFGLLSGHVTSGQFGVLPQCSKIFKRKRYYSRDRGDTIEFDISIEVTLPEAPEPSLLWLWECKNYSRSISVDDLEEFNSKVQQVSGLNVKAGVITAGALQRAALAYAASRKIIVIRVLPDHQVEYLLYWPMPGHPGTQVSSDCFAALSEPDFHSMNKHEFGAYDGQYFTTVRQLFSYALRAELPELPPSLTTYFS